MRSKTNIILKGKCISHEIDVLFKERELSLVECKFHGSVNAASDVVPLYIHSRYNDLKRTTRHFSNSDTISHCWIATNNRFTSDAIAYASCVDIQLLRDYPKTIA
jgi:hypothetical protein